jgi:hypothetical protein
MGGKRESYSEAQAEKEDDSCLESGFGACLGGKAGKD